MLSSCFAALVSYANTKKKKMASDSISLITLMVQNHFRQRRPTSEAELKDELVLHISWKEG